MATTVLHVDQRLISLQHVVETIQGLLANQERACNETLEQHKADTAKTLAMLSNVTVRRQPPIQTPLRIGYRYSPPSHSLVHDVLVSRRSSASNSTTKPRSYRCSSMPCQSKWHFSPSAWSTRR